MERHAASVRVTAAEKGGVKGGDGANTGNTRGLTSMFESMKRPARKSSSGSMSGVVGEPGDPKAYYKRAERQTFSAPSRESSVDHYNAELMAKVAEICESDRVNAQVTNYVEVKATLVELYGFDDFVKNKPFVTEYLVSNSRKVTDRGLVGISPKTSSLRKPTIASSVGNLFIKDVSEEEIRARVEELCKIANLANKEPQYMTIKSVLHKEFGARNFELHKDAITEQLSCAWAPAPPVRRASIVSDSSPNTDTNDSSSTPILETEEVNEDTSTTGENNVRQRVWDENDPRAQAQSQSSSPQQQPPQPNARQAALKAALIEKRKSAKINSGEITDPMLKMMNSEEKHYDYAQSGKPRINSVSENPTDTNIPPPPTSPPPPSARPAPTPQQLSPSATSPTPTISTTNNTDTIEEFVPDDDENVNSYLTQGPQEFTVAPKNSYSAMYAEPAVSVSRNQAKEHGFGDRAMSVHVRLSTEDSLYMEQLPDDVPQTLEEVEDPYGECTYSETNAAYAYPDDMMHSLGESADDQSLRDKAAQVPLDLSGFLNCEVLEYDKDESGRSRFLIQCKYNREPAWLVHKYYTDFHVLSEQMEKSKKLHKYAGGLPEKHGFGHIVKQQLSVKLAIGKKSAKKQQAEFMITRMEKIQNWLNEFCSQVCVDELQNESCVDEFLELFFRLQA
eukprot:m.196165 g.196165  ORF g.196165 m.196165 type:complete len:676 (+) comp32609_c1_seq2:288-2315(+)